MFSGNLSSLLASIQTRPGETAANVSRVGAYARGATLTGAQIDKTAQDFESMFIAQMLEQMFGDSIGTELFGNDETHEVYKALMMDEYGKEITKSGGIGIASYVKRELLRLQEV